MLVPDDGAALLAEHMVGADAVHRQILEETIESGERGRMMESGRTACGTVANLRPPVARHPRAVLLDECPPVQAAGIWHTHPAAGELRAPRHSLPDWANVVFGHYDVSIVTGTQSVHVVTAAADPQAMLAAFQEALGDVDVRTKGDVIDGLARGHIDHDAAVARVEAVLSPLVQRRPVGFDDLDRRASRVAPPAPTGPGPRGTSAAAACEACQLALSPDVGGLRRQARDAADGVEMIGRRVAAEGFDEAIGIVAGTIVSRWLFGQG